MIAEGAENLDTSTAGVDTDPTPDSGGAPETTSAGDSERQVREDRGIPHHRVEEMRRRDRESYEKKLTDLSKKLEGYDGYFQRMMQAERTRAQQMGLLPTEEEPRYISEDQYRQDLESLRQEQQESLQEYRLTVQAESEWKEVAIKHSEYVGVPGFQTEIFRQWIKNPNQTMGSIADSIVSQYEKFYASRANAAAEKAAKEKANGKIVVPAGGGSGSGKGSENKEEAKGQSVSKRILAKLSEGRG